MLVLGIMLAARTMIGFRIIRTFVKFWLQQGGMNTVLIVFRRRWTGADFSQLPISVVGASSPKRAPFGPTPRDNFFGNGAL